MQCEDQCRKLHDDVRQHPKMASEEASWSFSMSTEFVTMALPVLSVVKELSVYTMVG